MYLSRVRVSLGFQVRNPEGSPARPRRFEFADLEKYASDEEGDGLAASLSLDGEEGDETDDTDECDSCSAGSGDAEEPEQDAAARSHWRDMGRTGLGHMCARCAPRAHPLCSGRSKIQASQSNALKHISNQGG